MNMGTSLAFLILWLVPIDDSLSHSGRPGQFLERRRKPSSDFTIAELGELATNCCLM